MPAQTKQPKGGKNMTTSDTRKQRYAHYSAMHKFTENKFTSSQEHRGCGPLARYNRRRLLELQAIENGRRDHHPNYCELPLTDKSIRMLAFARRFGGYHG